MSRPPAHSPRLSRGLKAALATLLAASLAIAVGGCGGGEAQPSVHLLLEADTTELPPEANLDEAMTALQEVLERRALAFGIDGAQIEREDATRVSVDLRAPISVGDVRELMERRGILQLRQAVLDENGDIVCEAPDSTRFSVSREEITYTPEAPGDRPAPRCLASGGQTGQIVWEPAAAEAADGAEEAPPVMVQPLGAVVDRTREPVVVITLTPVDGQVLRAASERLVGLPLGFFLDEELLAGPTIQEPLTTDSVPIAGRNLLEAEMLVAQLSAGWLPMPVKEISLEEASE